MRTLPKLGFTNLTVSRDLYSRLTYLAKSNGDAGIPRSLENQFARSTVLQPKEAQNEPGSLLPREMAGRVGFEPTICGSAGRRLSPGSTTGPLVAEHGNHRLIINSDEKSQRGSPASQADKPVSNEPIG